MGFLVSQMSVKKCQPISWILENFAALRSQLYISSQLQVNKTRPDSPKIA